MARARDLLARFRPLAHPGEAAPAGVPADRGAELCRELQPLSDSLADTLGEARRLRSAAGADAARRLEREIAATRRRRRVVQDRWVPRLRAALADVELALEEGAREEGVRLRWAAGRSGLGAR